MSNYDNYKGGLGNFKNIVNSMDVQWFIIYYITCYVALDALTFFIRPASPAKTFLLNTFQLEPTSVGYLLLLTVPLIPAVYYFFRSFFHVIIALFPIMAVKMLLIWQVLTDENVPLGHLLAHLGILVSFFVLFVVFDKLQIERNANKILADKNLKLIEEMSRNIGNG